MNRAEFGKLLRDAEQKEKAAEHAWVEVKKVVEEMLANIMSTGSVIDVRRDTGVPLPDHLVMVRTIGGRDFGTTRFRIESKPIVELRKHGVEMSQWTCEATPISEKTGRDMNGRESSPVFRGKRRTVTLR